jgi:zinc transport system permease protein
VTRKISDRLLLGVVSEDLAKSTGVEMSKVNLIYLLMVGLAVALGVKFIGTLLTGAMVIVPAAAAKNFAGSVSEFQILAVLIGVVSAVFGIFIAGVWGIASGPAVVLVSVFIFILSYFFKKN